MEANLTSSVADLSDKVNDVVLKRIYAGQRAYYPNVATEDWYGGLLTHLQRSNGRFLRKSISEILAQHVRWHTRDIVRPDVSDTASVGRSVASMKRDGYSVFNLPSELIARVNESLANAQFASQAEPGETRSLDWALENGPGSSYSTCAAEKSGETNILKFPEIASIAQHPMILRVIEEHLGALPQLGSFEVSLNQAGRKGNIPSSDWHGDKGSIAFVKMFVYLNDVTDQNGPHGFVVGTHDPDFVRDSLRKCEALNPAQQAELLDQQRWSHDLIEQVFPGRAVFHKGSSGTAILEDTRGFHRATHLKSGHRLMVTLQWALDPTTLAQPEPIAFESIPSSIRPKNEQEETRFRYVFQKYLS